MKAATRMPTPLFTQHIFGNDQAIFIYTFIIHPYNLLNFMYTHYPPNKQAAMSSQGDSSENDEWDEWEFTPGILVRMKKLKPPASDMAANIDSNEGKNTKDTGKWEKSAFFKPADPLQDKGKGSSKTQNTTDEWWIVRQLIRADLLSGRKGGESGRRNKWAFFHSVEHTRGICRLHRRLVPDCCSMQRSLFIIALLFGMIILALMCFAQC
jgi:hypothetical protein